MANLERIHALVDEVFFYKEDSEQLHVGETALVNTTVTKVKINFLKTCLNV